MSRHTLIGVTLVAHRPEDGGGRRMHLQEFVHLPQAHALTKKVITAHWGQNCLVLYRHSSLAIPEAWDCSRTRPI